MRLSIMYVSTFTTDVILFINTKLYCIFFSYIFYAADSSFYDLYMGEDTSTETKEDALNLAFSANRRKEHFKSDIINYWDSVSITQVCIHQHNTR
jgi:hypothetical protein